RVDDFESKSYRQTSRIKPSSGISRVVTPDHRSRITLLKAYRWHHNKSTIHLAIGSERPQIEVPRRQGAERGVYIVDVWQHGGIQACVAKQLGADCFLFLRRHDFTR